MQWSSDKPTVQGWYWWRCEMIDVWAYPDKQGVFHVMEQDGRFFIRIPDRDEADHWVDQVDGSWAGPLEPPV